MSRATGGQAVVKHFCKITTQIKIYIHFVFKFKGRQQMEINADVPVWEKYTLTIEEASKYFRIGENKLRKLAEENLNSGWVIMNGNRIQIKRKKFEKIIDDIDII